MAKELGATAPDYEKQMDDVVDFEIALAKVSKIFFQRLNINKRIYYI